MRFGIIALVLVNGLAFGQGQKTTLFSVKNSPVTTEEFEYLYKKNHTQPGDFTELKIDEYLNLFINFKLKITEAKSRGLDTTRAFIKEYNTYKEELKKPYQANTDDLERLTREAYERLTTEVKAIHILVMIKTGAMPADTLAAYTKINELRARALAGQDFEKLARENSEDPSAKQNSGNLGYFTVMQMVYPFEDAAYKTNVGEISAIVRTRFGYHIIKVMDRRPGGEVEVSHILLNTGKGNATKVKNTIFEVYDQLKGGRKWEDVCKEFSEDTNSKNNGGRLRPFGVRALATLPDFEQVAFSLKSPGDISDPFQTNIGWHIIRLERKIPPPPYADVEPGLKRRVAHDERLTISKMKTLEKKKKELGYEEIDSVKTRVFSLADSALTKGKWHYSGDQRLPTRVLLVIRNEKIEVSKFLKFITDTQAVSSLSPSAYMQQLLESFVEAKINEQEENKLLTENPEYRMLLNEYKEGILLFEIMEKEVWNKASEDSVAQRNYFTHHADRFQAGNRVEARIYATTDKAFREEIKNKIMRGDTLRDADLKKFTSITNKKTFKGKDSQVVDQVSWVQGVHDAEVNGTYYLVEVIRLLPPGPQTFEEARATVISEYQDSLEKEWVSKLRKKYPVKINKEGRKAVMAALKK